MTNIKYTNDGKKVLIVGKLGKHYKCSRIRQERHAQILRNEEFDRLLMFDKKDSDDDQTISIPCTDANADQQEGVCDA